MFPHLVTLGIQLEITRATLSTPWRCACTLNYNFLLDIVTQDDLEKVRKMFNERHELAGK
jgi:hypothetical protein